MQELRRAAALVFPFLFDTGVQLLDIRGLLCYIFHFVML